jgi:hypothetical protein
MGSFLKVSKNIIFTLEKNNFDNFLALSTQELLGLGSAVEAAIAAIANSKSKHTAELPDASEVGKLIYPALLVPCCFLTYH